MPIAQQFDHYLLLVSASLSSPKYWHCKSLGSAERGLMSLPDSFRFEIDLLVLLGFISENPELLIS